MPKRCPHYKVELVEISATVPRWECTKCGASVVDFDPKRYDALMRGFAAKEQAFTRARREIGKMENLQDRDVKWVEEKARALLGTWTPHWDVDEPGLHLDASPAVWMFAAIYACEMSDYEKSQMIRARVGADGEIIPEMNETPTT